ncbi:MAG: hypothetical protein LBQ60_19785 [Bacteroidales bacterium]|jgi:hypothetical protein|nr:hypothetical protein [Bacteroidales bacterium]
MMRYTKYLVIFIAVIVVACEKDDEEMERWESLRGDHKFYNTIWFMSDGRDSITISFPGYPFALAYSWYQNKYGYWSLEEYYTYNACLQYKGITYDDKYRLIAWNVGEEDDREIIVEEGADGYTVYNMSDKLAKVELNRIWNYTDKLVSLEGEWAMNMTKDSIILVFESRLKEYIYQRGTNNILLYTDYGEYDIIQRTFYEGNRTIAELLGLFIEEEEKLKRIDLDLQGNQLYVGPGMLYINPGYYTKVK